MNYQINNIVSFNPVNRGSDEKYSFYRYNNNFTYNNLMKYNMDGRKMKYLRIIQLNASLMAIYLISLVMTVGLAGCGGDNTSTPSISLPGNSSIKAGDLKTNPTDGATMVGVPGGTFIMGSIDGVGYSNEQPAHQVTLSGYWIYKYEVTVAQYRVFCTATSRGLPRFPQPITDWGLSSNLSWQGTGWTEAAIQEHPIVNVTWYDCVAYATWAGVSLPTEAQWEYAARGPQERNYPWGGIATSIDNNNGWDQTKCANGDNSYDIGKSTWPVGSFSAGVSWCGAQDMSGNVWEWCNDWYSSYSSTTVTNPTGPTLGKNRVLRGGSWILNNYYNRSACRLDDGNPDGYYIGLGFRCASLGP